MLRNIEIKAHSRALNRCFQRLRLLQMKAQFEILQDDTFFACENGRMKLRGFSKEKGELIFYRRANQQGPKESFYLRSPTSSPDTLREALSQAYGRTRVHLDRAKHLGHFLELEVVLQEGESVGMGIKEAHNLMAQLGVEPSQLIEGAYIDLLSQTGAY